MKYSIHIISLLILTATDCFGQFSSAIVGPQSLIDSISNAGKKVMPAKKSDEEIAKDSIERMTSFSEDWKNDHLGLNGFRRKSITFDEQKNLFFVNGLNLKGYTKADIYNLLGSPDSYSRYTPTKGESYFGSKTELTRQTLTYIVHTNKESSKECASGLVIIMIRDKAAGIFLNTDCFKQIPCDSTVYMPNAFTPEDNGAFDEFSPVFGSDKPAQYELKVFNRYGEMVFKTNNYIEGWPGTYMNTSKELEVGVYAWQLDYRYMKNFEEIHTCNGSVYCVK